MAAGFPGDTPNIDVARREIERLKARRTDSLLCVGVLLALLPVALLWNPQAVAAVAIGVTTGGAIAVNAHVALADQLARCAALVGMSGIPDVARWHAELISAPRRHELAERLREIAGAGPSSDGRPPTGWSALLAVDRVQRVRPQLVELAATVEGTDCPDPVAVARLWQLVGDGRASPLYNTSLPAREVEEIVRQARWWLATGE